MTPLVFIDGDQGTTGLQVRQWLAGRTDLRVLQLPPAHRKSAAHRAEALNDCDVALLCLPDEAARQAVALVRRPGVRVIDASSAHRTAPGWVYGLPELDAEQAGRIASARRVSNPGCYPTGAVALLRPLVDAGLLPADHPLAIHAVSGYSGRGRAGLDDHEGAAAATAAPFQVYGLGLQHKHVPEIQQHAGLAHAPVFVPAYGHYRQGIVLTIALHLRLLPAGVTAARLHAALAARYAGQACIELQPLGADADAQRLDPRALNGSNRLRLAVFTQERTGQVLLSAVFDNLGKGAAGGAVQNLGLMLGLSAPWQLQAEAPAQAQAQTHGGLLAA
ncbi:N-acetyl-gamma-glutamyl-phosphate reductase [Pseudorhodoferax sp. Leaf274]|uniref:N-acetyl-gamma-glutamyl-phosphate reductase n=1 Tax=Pseudorhodoferax sp. Leaf274 TaxID=1736318 RepID=UPI000703982D|nr:N-acetyl-gamma-glutamyl-phosphate reductase [Pseudorhodoferax sp. Leaf274]KQP37120.1 N-acetyl-gamma-glutamyl-phosphate reductase [Pseudorhodoferax sp. Leaf274]